MWTLPSARTLVQALQPGRSRSGACLEKDLTNRIYYYASMTIGAPELQVLTPFNPGFNACLQAGREGNCTIGHC